jgi:hypothetical protein
MAGTPGQASNSVAGLSSAGSPKQCKRWIVIAITATPKQTAQNTPRLGDGDSALYRFFGEV